MLQNQEPKEESVILVYLISVIFNFIFFDDPCSNNLPGITMVKINHENIFILFNLSDCESKVKFMKFKRFLNIANYVILTRKFEIDYD